MKQDKSLDFKGQKFFVGIDIHKNQWDITIRQGGMYLKHFSIDPSPQILSDYLLKNYPGGDYHSVYEAGFSGYWAHRQLCEYGVGNIVINAADVPTSDKERRRKTDRVDSNKLSRELFNCSLEAIYIPSPTQQALRSLVHLRERDVSHQTRLKNRIKMYLHFYGVKIPAHRECRHWSRRFIRHLEQLTFEDSIAKQTFCNNLQELSDARVNLLRVTRQLRKYVKESGFCHIINNLMTIPGVGFTVSVTFYSEICDITRFETFAKLCAYVGLVPSERSSGDKSRTIGIPPRGNRKLRYLLIEASWASLRNDPVMLMSYNKLTLRMDSKKAIIRIAKKLLRRMRYVWLNNQPYVLSVVD